MLAVLMALVSIRNRFLAELVEKRLAGQHFWCTASGRSQGKQQNNCQDDCTHHVISSSSEATTSGIRAGRKEYPILPPLKRQTCAQVVARLSCASRRRTEGQTSELQRRFGTSYAVF